MANQEQTQARLPMTEKMIKVAKMQSAKATRLDMTKFTYERVRSHYKDAKADLSVFDEGGKLIFLGRDFGDRVFYWEPTAEA